MHRYQLLTLIIPHPATSHVARYKSSDTPGTRSWRKFRHTFVNLPLPWDPIEQSPGQSRHPRLMGLATYQGSSRIPPLILPCDDHQNFLRRRDDAPSNGLKGRN